MKWKIGLAVLSILVCQSAGAIEIRCPEMVSVDQKIIDIPKGWNLSHSQFHPKLEWVALYDGPPEKLGNLKPDNGDSNDTFAIWSLGESQGNGYWLECHYSGTTITLTQRLPKGVKTCKVTYDPEITQKIQNIKCE